MICEVRDAIDDNSERFLSQGETDAALASHRKLKDSLIPLRITIQHD